MSKADKAEVKATETTIESLAKRVNDLEAKLRRYSDNWKKFAATHLGVDAKDGALGGFSRVMVLVCVLAVALVGVAVATDYLIMENPGDVTKFSVDTDGNVYAAGNIASAQTTNTVVIGQITNALAGNTAKTIGGDVTVSTGSVTAVSFIAAVAGTGTNTLTTGANLDASKLSGNTPIASVTNALAGNTAKSIGGNITTTGTVTIAEGALTDSTIVSADIKAGEVGLTDLGTLGITTNIDVLISGGGTNTLSFTNGILRVATVL
jgi:hypothetical protein